MIKRMMFIEDGTVDLDELKEELGEDTKVIVYRQGAHSPSVLELKEPATYSYENEIENNRLKKENSSLQTQIKVLTNKNNELEDALTVACTIICDKCGKEYEQCAGCKITNKDELIKEGRMI